MHRWLFKSTKISIKTGSSEEVKETSSSRAGPHTENQSRRRLVRSPNIRGLRYSDDDLSNDASTSSLFSSEHSSETVSVGSRSSSPSIQIPRNAVTYLPPPSLTGSMLQHTSPRSWDGVMRASNGYSSIDDSSSAVTSCSKRGFPGMHVGSSAGVAALQRSDQGYGVGLHIHTHVGKSDQNNALTCPVTSPKTWGSKDSQWLWSYASNSLTSMGSSYDNSTWTDTRSLSLPPTLSMISSSPPTSPLSPGSSIGTPRGSSKLESGPPVCKWQKGRLLGSGAFGRVFKGIHCETGEFCAIKEVEYVEDDPKAEESAKQLEQEIMLLNSFRHPNIVHYKGSEMEDGCLKIYLELVLGGSIYKLCQEFKKLEEPVVRRYTRQILHGLHYLHSENIVHRDIKGANILVDQEGTVKLADFGVAKQIKKQGCPLSFKGSPYWMAPEVIMQENTQFECAIDIWSLGCTVLEMVTGKPPWSEYERNAAMCKVSRAEIPPIPQSLSLEGQSFIKLCLQRNPVDRPSAAALLQHPFVQIPNDCPALTMQAMNIPDFLVRVLHEKF